jgi:hypothetical protein
MSLLDLFKGQKNHLGTLPTEANSGILDQKMLNGHDVEQSHNRNAGQAQTTERADIPEHVFIEHEKPKPKEPTESSQVKPDVLDLQTLYHHLGQNLERNGYEDALTNPDTSYMEEQIQYIYNELGLLIAKIKTYYANHIRNIDFHIDTRKRCGMIETVDELLSYKQTVLEAIQKVSEIETDMSKGVGVSQNLMLSYRRGFRNGFAAITYGTVLSRKH